MKAFSKRISRALSWVLAAAMTIAPISVSAAPSSDVSGHWAERTITDWQDKGLISGYEDGTFRPNKAVTRAEFVRIMNQALGFNTEGTVSFSDVKSSDWYYNAVAIAMGEAYTSGFPDGTFRPNETVTRGQAAVFIANAIDAQGGSVAGFTDAAAIPTWAQSAIGAMADLGYMSGYQEDGSFRANGALTRAEAVSTLNRVMGNAVTPDVDNKPTDGEENTTDTLVIDKSGTTVKNQTVTGNLTISEKVGNGDVTLENVVVEGNLIVRGGGSKSINLNNVTVQGKLIADKDGVRINLSGDSKIATLEIRQACNVTTTRFTGSVDKINVVSEISNKITIDVAADTLVVEEKAYIALNQSVENVMISENAGGTRLALAKGVKVDTLTADAKVALSGNGAIAVLEANESGITYTSGLDIDKTKTASGVDKPKPASSGGGGGGSSSGGGGTVTTTAEVATAGELQDAIADQNITTINVTGNISDAVRATRTGSKALTINFGTATVANLSITAADATSIKLNDAGAADAGAKITGVLVIDAPKAHVENNLVVEGGITIVAVANSTFLQKDEVGNVIDMTGSGKLEIADTLTTPPDVTIQTAEPITLTGTIGNVVVIDNNAKVSTPAGGSTAIESISVTNGTSGVALTLNNATIGTVETAGAGTTINATSNTTVETLTVATNADNSTLQLEGTVTTLNVVADNTETTMKSGASVEQATVSGNNATVNVTGSNTSVEKVTVSGTDAQVTVAEQATAGEVAVTGTGTNATVEVTGDNTTLDKVNVEGTGATVNTGANATVNQVQTSKDVTIKGEGKVEEVQADTTDGGVQVKVDGTATVEQVTNTGTGNVVIAGDSENKPSDAAKKAAAPTGLGSTPAANATAANGAITGTNGNMEYRAEGVDTYTKVIDTPPVNLAKGTYYVRVAADTTADPQVLASDDVKVVVLATVSEKAITGVIAPVTGAAPMKSITATAEYTGTVEWSPAPVGGKFAAGTKYTATITLTPKAGFTFEGVTQDSFTVAGATATNAANSGVVEAVFPTTEATTITVANIAGVAAPVTGETAVTTITATSQYTGTVAWTPALDAQGKFEAGTEYTATITLAPKTGYTLTGVEANFFKVAGATATNLADSDEVKAVFPKTAKGSQTAPQNLAGVAPTAEGGKDGKITGTTVAMQYKRAVAADTEYHTCGDRETTKLEAGDYVVRYAATDKLNASATTAVTVPAYTTETVKVAGITVTGAGDATEVKAGETLQMSASVEPANATNKEVTWSVEAGTGTASIDTDGLLTGTKEGTVTVKATAEDGSGVTGTKTITVTAKAPEPVPVTSITVTSAGDATEVKVGETLQMSAAVLPAEATDKTVTWSVEAGAGTANIDQNGLLTGGTAGTVTVKATAKDGSGVTGTKTITVTAKASEPTDKEITGFTPLTDVTLDSDEHLTTLDLLKASGKLPTKVMLTHAEGSVEADTVWTGAFDGTVKEHTLTAVWTMPDGYVDNESPIAVTVKVNVTVAQTEATDPTAGAKAQLAKIDVTTVEVDELTLPKANAAIIAAAQLKVDNGYAVTLAEGSALNGNTWTGKFIVTETDVQANTATSVENVSITVTVAETEPTPINTVALTGLTAPATGATPVTAQDIQGAQHFTVTSLTWKVKGGAELGVNDKFAAGTVYQAVLTLTAEEKYAFADGVKDTATVDGNKPAEVVLDTTLTVTVDFAETEKAEPETTPINTVALTGLTAPATGGTPVAVEAIQGAEHFVVTSLTWNTVTDGTATAMQDDKFAAETVYQAVLVLTADANYAFKTGITADEVTVDAKKPTAVVLDTTLTVTVDFAATEPAEPEITEIATLAFTGFVVPEVGATPMTAAELNAADGFKGFAYTAKDLAWVKGNTQDEVTQFAAGNTYTATITLEAKAGNTFKATSSYTDVKIGDVAVTFTDNTQTSNTLVAKASFTLVAADKPAAPEFAQDGAVATIAADATSAEFTLKEAVVDVTSYKMYDATTEGNLKASGTASGATVTMTGESGAAITAGKYYIAAVNATGESERTEVTVLNTQATPALSATMKADGSDLAGVNTLVLTGATTAMEYSTDGTNYTECVVDQTVALTEAGTVYVRLAAKAAEFLAASEAQTFEIAVAPEKITMVAGDDATKTVFPTELTALGLEYSKTATINWVVVTDDLVVESVASGDKLYVRTKATDGLPSLAIEVDVKVGEAAQAPEAPTFTSTEVTIAAEATSAEFTLSKEVADVTYKMYDASTEGTLKASGTASGVTVTMTGEASAAIAAGKYYIAAVNATGESDRTEVTVLNPQEKPNLTAEMKTDGSNLAGVNTLVLTGATTAMEYSTDDTTYTKCGVDQAVELTGKAAVTVYVRLAADPDNFLAASEAQEIVVAAAPAEIKMEAGADATHTKFPTEVAEGLEYSTDGANWTDVSAAEVAVTGAGDTIYVRTKATGGLPSLAIAVAAVVGQTAQ